MALPFLFFHFIRDFFSKRKLPKKDKVKNYLESNKEFFSYNPQSNIDEKEVEKDAQEKRRKFREFEQLRRLSTTQGFPSRARGIEQLSHRGEELSKQRILPNEVDSNTPTNVDGVKHHRKKIKLDD